MARRSRTPLTPGHLAWAELNAEKREAQRMHDRDLTPAERLRAGVALSQEAMRLLRATERTRGERA